MRTVVVSGASGGMGRAAVSALLQNGYRVIALDRKNADLGEGVNFIELDLTDTESVDAAIEKIKGITDEIYAIVHFAGVYMLDSFIEIEWESLKKIFDINLFGAMLLNRGLLPLLSSGSRIVITTSELAPLDPLPFTGIYAVSKAALDKYAYSLAMELKLLGVSVSVIRAGAVDTDMIGASVAALDRFCEKTSLYSCNAARFKRIVEGVEARRVATAKIADKMLSILRKRKPKFTYNINRNPLLLLLNAMPKSFQLWVISKILEP